MATKKNVMFYKLYGMLFCKLFLKRRRKWGNKGININLNGLNLIRGALPPAIRHPPQYGDLDFVIADFDWFKKKNRRRMVCYYVIIVNLCTRTSWLYQLICIRLTSRTDSEHNVEEASGRWLFDDSGLCSLFCFKKNQFRFSSWANLHPLRASEYIFFVFFSEIYSNIFSSNFISYDTLKYLNHFPIVDFASIYFSKE